MGNSISTATTVQALEYTEYSVRDRIMFGSYAEDVINAISEYFKLQLTLLKGNTVEVPNVTLDVQKLIENSIKAINNEYTLKFNNLIALTPNPTEEEIKKATEETNNEFMKSVELTFLNELKKVAILTKEVEGEMSMYSYDRKHLSVAYIIIMKYILDNMYINQTIKYNYVQLMILMYLCGLFDEYDSADYVPEMKLSITPESILKVKYAKDEYKHKLGSLSGINIENDIIKFTFTEGVSMQVPLRSIGEFYKDKVLHTINTKDLMIGRGIRTCAGTLALACNSGAFNKNTIGFDMTGNQLNNDGIYRGVMNNLFSVYINIANMYKSAITEVINEEPENKDELLKNMHKTDTPVAEEPEEVFKRVTITADGKIVDFREEDDIPPFESPPVIEEDEDEKEKEEDSKKEEQQQKEEEKKDESKEDKKEQNSETGFVDKMKNKWKSLDKNKQAGIVIGAVVLVMVVLCFIIWVCTRGGSGDEYVEDEYVEDGYQEEYQQDGYQQEYQQDEYVEDGYQQEYAENYNDQIEIPEEYMQNEYVETPVQNEPIPEIPVQNEYVEQSVQNEPIPEQLEQNIIPETQPVQQTAFPTASHQTEFVQQEFF